MTLPTSRPRRKRQRPPNSWWPRRWRKWSVRISSSESS
jgi:hypothetical protein